MFRPGSVLRFFFFVFVDADELHSRPEGRTLVVHRVAVKSMQIVHF